MTRQDPRRPTAVTAWWWAPLGPRQTFGSPPRRLVLRFVLDNEPPKDGWTKTDIAEDCGLSKYGGATDHVRGLVALDLLDEEDGRYRTGPLDGALFARVAALVDELEHVPDRPIDEVLKGNMTAEALQQPRACISNVRTVNQTGLSADDAFPEGRAGVRERVALVGLGAARAGCVRALAEA